jgi:hypothetical protein
VSGFQFKPGASPVSNMQEKAATQRGLEAKSTSNCAKPTYPSFYQLLSVRQKNRTTKQEWAAV